MRRETSSSSKKTSKMDILIKEIEVYDDTLKSLRGKILSKI